MKSRGALTQSIMVDGKYGSVALGSCSHQLEHSPRVASRGLVSRLTDLFQQTWNLKKSVGRRDKRRFRSLFENLEDSQCSEFQEEDSWPAETCSDRGRSTMVETVRGLSPLRASRQLCRNWESRTLGLSLQAICSQHRPNV